ncbi:MAG TPA: DUF2288 domain-containing protein [Leptolyngbyaceae cyanobacterium M33_DOE_097]|uniref:DUF2288 domain-containing protein n=1 Tax=Oscillatoriales cyanobacterium SpSt-418 TaxID=2282169 RepID=A0A7C3PNI2_9CYAN|nr:DUF2288 domain-containing protein [Leptolyngbyaceae cyanobacterium M33_DOE_097]
MSDLRSELAESLDEAEWDWLEPHAKRDSVILVNHDLNLVDVGEAIANDNVTSVQRWIAEALIQKPSPQQISDWNQNRTKRFNALIVQPYVLVQER